MCKPRNLKLSTRDDQLMEIRICFSLIFLNDFFCFIDIWGEVFLFTLYGQVFHLLSIVPLTTVAYQSHLCGVICKFYDSVVVIFGNTFLCKQTVLQGTQKAALRHALQMRMVYLFSQSRNCFPENCIESKSVINKQKCNLCIFDFKVY